MANMKSFVMWFLAELPDFFMSEPIIYFVGFALLGFVVAIVLRLTKLK